MTAGCSPAGEPGQQLAPLPAGAILEERGGATDRPAPPAAPPAAPPCCCMHWGPGIEFWVHTELGDGTPPAAGLLLPTSAEEVDENSLRLLRGV